MNVQLKYKLFFIAFLFATNIVAMNHWDNTQDTIIYSPLRGVEREPLTYIIKAGTDLLDVSRDGFAPLDLATIHGSIDLLQSMLQTYEETYHHINRTTQLTHLLFRLSEASGTRTVEKLKLLLSKGADPRARNKKGETPLIIWANSWPGNAKAMKALLKSGADVNAQPKYINHDALWGAIHYRHEENCLKTLINHGAKIGYHHLLEAREQNVNFW